MSNRLFADFHCHPHFRAYNFLRNSSEYNSKKYHPWTVILGSNKEEEAGGRGFSYSQCDFSQLQSSGTRLVFASLYPFEKGFFSGNGKLDGRLVNRIMNVLDKVPVLGNAAILALTPLVKGVFSSSGEVT